MADPMPQANYMGPNFGGIPPDYQAPPPPTPQMQSNQPSSPSPLYQPGANLEQQNQSASNMYTQKQTMTQNSTNDFESSNEQWNDDDAYQFRSPDAPHTRAIRYISNRYQLLLDISTPHWAARWSFSIFILLIFMLRIVMAQGWYVICYGLSIYYLNLFIGFLSPKIDPAFNAGGEFDDTDGPMLPTKASDEFRPFIRRLPEFKFWLSATTATLIALFLTLFEMFDVPVFWPILLLYFILLFVSTMRQQIRHMIKYGYVPWDKGKKKYGNQSEEPNKLFSSAT